jgi:hypothetical protein
MESFSFPNNVENTTADVETKKAYNADDLLPEILIISHQRSGTHMLESFLKSHPMINGKGEILLKYETSGLLEKNQQNKKNVGILMYGQMNTFERIGGILKKHKIIHLLRNPEDVALSILQMKSDKEIQKSDYKAHYKENETIPKRNNLKYSKLELLILEKMIAYKQIKYSEILSKIGCLEITYESMAPNNKTVKELDGKIAKRIFEFLDLKMENPCKIQTRYIKTGINISNARDR